MTPKSSSAALVLLPTYNEIDNLRRVMTRIRTSVPDADVLVLDDDSPDGTGKLADELAAQDSAIHVLHRTSKEGLGAAYLAGFGWGLERGYDLLIEIDADGSHPAELLPAMLAQAADGADLVIGSRYVPGGAVVNWPLHRQLLSRVGNQYVRVLLGMPVRDATAGFRVYRADALQQLALDTVQSHGYCFQTDLTWRAARAGMDIREVPITFTEREFGDSKMSGDVVRESMRSITGWGLRHRAAQVRRLVGR